MEELGRREFLQVALLWMASCQQKPVFKVVSNTWPGYELMHTAARQGYFDRQNIRVVRMSSATVAIQALVTGQADAAGLTLDEVLTAATAGLTLKVVAVFDVSNGADMILARPGISTRQEVIGKTICVENSAVGAVMLDAFLKQQNLTLQDIKLIYATVDTHLEKYQNQEADILVTFNPTAAQLKAEQAQILFDSSQVPGMIVDVLVVREDVLPEFTNAITALIEGHFATLQKLQSQDAAVAADVASGLGIPVAQLSEVFQGLKLPTLAENREWLTPDNQGSHLTRTADFLQQSMLQAGLLSKTMDVAAIGTAQFLPQG